MEQSAGDLGVPVPIPSEHPIIIDSTSEQRSIEESKIGKSFTMEHQGQEGLTPDHYPTLEVLFNALRDVSQKITADTFIIIDGWDECNKDSENEFRHLFVVLSTMRWKILFTSRGIPIEPDSAYCLSFHIQQTDNAEDVRAFTENGTKHTLLQKYQGFRQKAIQNIIETSQGM